MRVSTPGSATPRLVTGSGATGPLSGVKCGVTAIPTGIITPGWPTPMPLGKAHRPKAVKLIGNPVCASIEAWMDDGWSPKPIAQMLARDHPDDTLAPVSHETIYKCL